NLRLVHLERPLQRRLELLCVTLYAASRAEREEVGEERADHTHVFQHADARQLEEAMRRVAAHTRSPMSSRKTSDVRLLVQFLADYPDAHRGNFIGLTDRAIRWHRDRHKQ